MAFTTFQTTVAEMAQAAYGRVLSDSGLDHYAGLLESGVQSAAEIMNEFMTNNEAAIRYPATANSIDAVQQVFTNVLGRNAADAGAQAYADLLDAGTLTKIELVTQILADAKSGGGDEAYLNSQVAVAEAAYNGTSSGSGTTFTVTNGSDKATANIFNADMVYNPAGDDRILSLQDEDDLTGEAGATNNTLNAEIGNINGNEVTTAVTTPGLNNIQILNIDWTGNTNTLDLRYSDSVDTININKITQDANAVTVQNITTVADTLKIQDVYDNTSTQTFQYVRGVLDGSTDTLNLTENNVLTNTQTFNVGGGANEGFESVNMTVSGGVDIQTGFNVSDMENLTITGSGNLDILNQVWTANEYNLFTAAIANAGSLGQRTIDLSGFSGTSNIDVTLGMGAKVDTAASGANFHTVITGGTGDDTFHTSAAMAVSANGTQDGIDGGTGTNTLVTYVGTIAGTVTNTNIQALEIRDQGALGVTDMDAFDSALTSVYMRDEDAGASTFTLNDVSAALAADGMTLAHNIAAGGAQVVVANLKVATGATDTMALTVEDSVSATPGAFNYTFTAGGTDTDGILGNVNTGVAATSDADAIENVTLHDNDTESNTVTLTNIINHTGTTTLDGGTAGLTYTVAGTLNSATVDASAQASNTRLTVGDTVGTITTISQDVKLGTGDDVLTFANIDELDATDSLTDAGGNDTVRAAFANDSSVDVAGIENLHVTATANVTLDMASADVTNLVLLANSASLGGGTTATGDLSNNGTADINIAGGSLAANIITLDNSTLTQLNFFGDADNDDDVVAGVGTANDDIVAHTFNGVTLSNNSSTDITANINTSLDENQLASTGGGAATYGIGQITTHGNTGMDIVVGNERINAGTTTTIANIYAKTMDTLTATATGNLTLGTVSGAPLANSLSTFDMSGVAGIVTANVISLGDDAVVTLAGANNVVSALGSAGKDVVMTAGNGNNTLTGTAQDDTITTGTGWDTINGNRGDNVINSAAGNDTVTAGEGNDTIDLGTGIDVYQDNLSSGFSGAAATNSISMSGGIAAVGIDTNGTGGTYTVATGVFNAATEVDQMLAVGNGSDLTVSFTGAVMNTGTAVLDGTLAQVVVSGGNTEAMTAGSDLVILTTGAAAETIAGGAGNDVVMYSGSAAGDGVTFTGGAGNDAVVGSINVDALTGGTGADYYIMADVSAGDANSDRVIIADGDSLASGWDIISKFDANGAAGVAAAVVGAATAGDDILDLDSTSITAYVSPALTTNIATTNGAVTANGFNVTATGLLTFDNTTAGAAVTLIGTGAAQITLANTLTMLAVELNGTGDTVTFAYDTNGNGAVDAGVDSTFVFQDGVNDTVVELVGLTGITGLEAVTGGTANVIEIM